MSTAISNVDPGLDERLVQFLNSDRAGAVLRERWDVGNMKKGTTFPARPVPGQVFVYEADATNSRNWTFRFNPLLPSVFQWEFIGGPPMRASTTGTPSTSTSTTYVDLSIPGPSITVPLAGDYNVQWWAQAQNDTVAALVYMAIKQGAAAAADADSVRGQVPVANHDVKIPTGSKDFSVATAGTILKAQYRVSAGTMTVNNHLGPGPWMQVVPIRVSAP